MIIDDRLYEIDKISFYYMTISAHEIVQQSEELLEKNILDVAGFKGLTIKLTDESGQTKIIK